MNTRFVVAILLGLIGFACAESCVRNLYAYDPFYSSFSLKDGFAGFTAQNYRPYNRDSAITYSIYYPNMITLSPQGGDRAAFYDLGTNYLFGYRYNVSLTGANSAYTGIHVNTEGQIVYATSDTYNPDDKKAFQPFPSYVTSSLQSLGSGLAASFYPEVGHLYLIKIYNSQYSESYLTKLIVLGISADNTTVAVRWDVIDSTLEATRQANCWISIDTSPAEPNNGNLDNAPSTTALGYYNGLRPLVIAVSVILPVLFVLIVLLFVFVLVLFKNIKKFSSYYSTPMPKMDEKKHLIQK